MRIEIEHPSSKGINIVRFVRGNDVRLWATPGYNSASIPDRDNLFEDLNRLVAMMPKEKQETLWALYMEAREVIDTIFDPVALEMQLKLIIRRIYEQVSYMECRRYVYHGGDVQFPSTVKTEYTENDIRGRNYQERTYLREDYIDLVILTLGLRFMIPIWGEYIARVIKHTGNEYKEKSAMDLLAGSELNNWKAMSRLRVYVESSILDHKASLSQLLGGLASTEIPEHLTALAVVRRLAVSPLSPRTDDDNLIRLLYNFVTGNFTRLDTRFNGNVGDKKLIKENAEDDNSSVWDMCKVHQDVPDGDKMLIEVFTEDAITMAESLRLDLDPARLQRCLTMAAKLEDLPIQKHHRAFVQWILARIIPPKGIETLPKPALLRCMAVTQTVLWEWGFTELALLATARRYDVSGDGMFASVESRSKVKRETVERLNELYPYWRRDTRKLDPAKRTNVATRAIDILAEELNRGEWIPHAPKALVDSFGNVSVSKRWTVSGDIKMQLAQLIIRMNEPVVNI